MVPIYRAKKIDSGEWVEGYLSYDRFLDCYFMDIGEEFNIEVDLNYEITRVYNKESNDEIN